MPGHLPNLDRQALARLRTLVGAMHTDEGRAVPFDQLVRLAGDVGLAGGVTIDFLASRELGQPMVVLRLNAETTTVDCLAVLSKREREVAGLVADGLTNKEIAKRLFVSPATVKDHVHHILSKARLPNRAAIASASSGRGSPPTSTVPDSAFVRPAPA